MNSSRYSLAPLLAGAAGFVALARVVRFIMHRWERIQGYEAEWIAQSIVNGHGFSMPGDRRPLFDHWAQDPTQYFPTAWMDPVYTYVLAGAIFVFGDGAYAAMLLLNVACLAFVMYCAYRLVSTVAGPWAGALAIVIFAVHTHLPSGYGGINNAALGSALLMASALTTVRYFERPTWPRLAVMGLVVGFTILGASSGQYVAYGLAVAVAVKHLRSPMQAAGRVLALILLAAIVVAPWSYRNFLTFDQWVLSRNGAGQLSFVATVAAAETFMPGVAETSAPVPWRSSGPREAILNMLDMPKRQALNRYQLEAFIATPPAGYAGHERGRAGQGVLFEDNGLHHEISACLR